jgi:hypothetical protein
MFTVDLLMCSPTKLSEVDVFLFFLHMIRDQGEDSCEQHNQGTTL